MADDRTSAGPPRQAGDVHDDDELADAMAAEFERYATGAVPVIVAQRPLPQRPVPQPPERVPAPAPPPTSGDAPPAFAGSGRRRPDPVLPPDEIRTPNTDELPTVRRSGFRRPARPVVQEPADVAPIERVLPTGPIDLPEPTAALLDEMLQDPDRRRAPRHAAVPIDPELDDPLSRTGPLSVPAGLYDDWEHSLREIGRPQDLEPGPLEPSAGPDTATVALRLPLTGSAPQAPAAPVPAPAPAPAVVPPVSLHPASIPLPVIPSTTAPVDPVPSGPVSVDTAATRRGRRRAAAAPELDEEVDGIDDTAEVAVPMARPATGPLPQQAAPAAVVSRPATGPVLVERLRTAILQLQSMPARPTGSRPSAVVARWVGAFASPVVLLVGFAVAGAGGGPAAALAAVLGALLVLPAAARAGAWSARNRQDGERLEIALLGRSAGRLAAVLLLLARLAAAALSLVAIGTVAGAFAARTGALGGSGTGAQVVAVAGTGAAALAVSVWSDRVAAVLSLVLGAIGVVVGVFVLAVLLTAAGGAPAAGQGGVPAGLGAGFAAIGLMLVLAGPDVARWRTAEPRPSAAAAGGALTVAAGAVLVAVAVLAGTTAGAAGTPDDALASALGDGTADLLAGPLAVALLLGALALPALLLRSTGAAAARLVGDGSAVRLGSLSAGLLAIAVALGVVSTGQNVETAAGVAAATLGVPVAAWAGALTTGRTSGSRGTRLAVTTMTSTLFGWVLADGIVPGWSSPLLNLAGIGAATGWRGGSVVGLLAAFLLSALGGLVARQRTAPEPVRRDPADSVEG